MQKRTPRYIWHCSQPTMVQLHALWVFSRRGHCVYYEEFYSGSASSSSNASASAPSSSTSAPVKQLQAQAIAAAEAAGDAPAGSSADAVKGRSKLPLDEIHKLMYGMLYSLKRLVEKCTPTSAEPAGADAGLKGFVTNAYRLHFIESASRLKLVLMTEPGAPDLQDTLRSIFSNIYVEHVAKNPRYDAASGLEPITSQNCEHFVDNLRREMQLLALGPTSGGKNK